MIFISWTGAIIATAVGITISTLVSGAAKLKKEGTKGFDKDIAEIVVKGVTAIFTNTEGIKSDSDNKIEDKDT